MSTAFCGNSSQELDEVIILLETHGFVCTKTTDGRGVSCSKYEDGGICENRIDIAWFADGVYMVYNGYVSCGKVCQPYELENVVKSAIHSLTTFSPKKEVAV